MEKRNDPYVSPEQRRLLESIIVKFSANFDRVTVPLDDPCAVPIIVADQHDRPVITPTFTVDPKTMIALGKTPAIFKAAQATAAGSTALWTPSVATLKFRLLGGVIVLSKEAACAGAEFVELLDGSAHITLRWDFSAVALAAIGVCTVIPFDLKPNGYISATAGNVLNISLNGALTAGNCSVSVWGVEE